MKCFNLVLLVLVEKGQLTKLHVSTSPFLVQCLSAYSSFVGLSKEGNEMLLHREFANEKEGFWLSYLARRFCHRYKSIFATDLDELGLGHAAVRLFKPIRFL